MRRLPRLSVRAHVALLTLAFVLTGAAFAIAAPLFQAPDEPPHVDMVRHYAKHPLDLADKNLKIRRAVQNAVDQTGLNQGGPIDWNAPSAPTQRPIYPSFDEYPFADGPAAECPVGGANGWRSCQNYHYGHPPTFYVLMAIPDRLLHGFGFPTEVLVLRLLCLLLVAPVVPLTYYAARQVWTRSTTLPLAAATLVALFAPFAAAAAAVNNDAMMLLCAGALIAACARLLRAPSARTAIAVGAACGAGLLIKSNFQALTAAAGLIVLVALTAIPRRDWVRTILGFAVPALIGAAFWLSNLVRFHTIGQPGGEILRPSTPGPHRSVSIFRYALDHGGDMIGRFWGLYGQTAVDTPSFWRTALSWAAALLLVAGLAAWLVRRPSRPSPASIRLCALGIIPLTLAAGVVLSSFQVFHKNGEVRGLLGRYLYAGLPVVAIAAVAALAAIVTLASPMLSGSSVPQRGANSRKAVVGRAVVFAVGTLVAAVVCVAMFARAVHGFYGTRDAHEVLARMSYVSGVARPRLTLVALLAPWAIAVVASAYGVFSRTSDAYADVDAAR